MIDIKDRSGNIRLSTQINLGAKGKFSLMKEDYITLPFTLSSPVHFQNGDYVDLTGMFDASMGGKLSKIYEIVDVQMPTRSRETGGYEYNLRLDAYYIKWKNKIFKYLPEDHSQEASWSLTAALSVHLDVFLRNLKALQYKYRGSDFQYNIDATVPSKAISLTYSNTNMLDALTMMAEALECEWWITDNVIHFGRCEFGSPVRIELFKEAADMSRTESKGLFATRIYAFGSEKNIPTDYRPTTENVVVNGVVQRRLMLPEGVPYLDAYPNMTDEEAVEAVVTFDVYPRRVDTMSDVTSYQSTVDNADGTKTTAVFYRYKDTRLNFDNSYILEGQELKIKFESGLLNGLTFGVTFNPTGRDNKQWEIVANEDYGRLLPDDVIKPQNGDKYVLSGYDTKFVSVDMLPNAERELQTEAEKFLEKSQIDNSTFTVPLYSTWVQQDQIHRTFDVGQKINLINDAFFKNGRISRVIGWEFNLDIPYDTPTYTIGESPAYSRLGNLEEKIDALTFKGQTFKGSGGGGPGVYIISTNDVTAPSDSNVFSALRQIAEFLSKKKDDSAQGLITFLRGANFGDYAEGLTGFGGHVDGNGNAELNSLSLRRFLEVPELRYNRVSVKVGNSWNGPGGGIIESCVPDLDTQGHPTNTGLITLHLEDGEIGTIDVDDLCQGIFHNEVNTQQNETEDADDGRGNFKFAGFFTAYFRVTSIVDTAKKSSFRYELRPMSQGWNRKYHPVASMHFVAYGNKTNPERQTSRYSTRTYERYLAGVDDWEFRKENIVSQYGDLENLSIFGLHMDGYSSYLKNVYMSGTIQQFEDAGYRSELITTAGEYLDEGDVNTISLVVKDGYGRDVTSQFRIRNVSRYTGNNAADTQWGQNFIQRYNGSIPNPFEISLNDIGQNKSAQFDVIAEDIINGVLMKS